MKRLKELYDKYFEAISIVLLIIIIVILCFIVYIESTKTKKSSNKLIDILPKVSAKAIDNDVKENIKVDIKGAIKNPGVYEVSNNSNVSDLINMAGGLTKKATTSNINLSRVLEDQMVVKIYTIDELKKTGIKDVSECVCPEAEITKCENNSIIKTTGDNINAVITQDNDDINADSSKTKLISINTATKEELMTVSGIGESKAIAIIEYRNNNGSFNNIEDIKNVSGIGDSLFEKIKSYITI